MEGQGKEMARASEFWGGLPHHVVIHDRWAVDLAFAKVHPGGTYREPQINAALSIVSLKLVEIVGMFEKLERLSPFEAERKLDALASVALDEENEFVGMLAGDWGLRTQVLEISCAAFAAHAEVIRYKADSNAKSYGLEGLGEAWTSSMYARAFRHMEDTGLLWSDPLPKGIVPGNFVTLAGEVAVRELFRRGNPDPLMRASPEAKRDGNVTYAFGAEPPRLATAGQALGLLQREEFFNDGGK